MITHASASRRAVGLCTLVALTTGLAACGSSSNGGSSGGGLPASIPVAVVTAQTGNFAAIGTEYLEGVQLAVDEINASDMLGDSEIDLTVEDTASTPATASGVVSQLVTTDTVAILGLVTSPESLAASPIAQQAGVPMLNNTAPPGLVEIGDYVWSLAQVFVSSIPLLTERIAEQVGSVNIIYSTDIPTLSDYNEKLSASLTEAGVTVGESVGTLNAATDFSAVITRAMRGSPEGIVIDTASVGVLSLVEGLRRAGYEGKLFGAPSAAALADAPAVANGVEFPTVWVETLDNPENDRFMELFREAHPDGTATYETSDGYAAMHFLAKAIEQVGEADRDAILEGMKQVAAEGMAAPAGEITFGGPGGRQYNAPGVYVVVQNGKFEIVPED